MGTPDRPWLEQPLHISATRWSAIECHALAAYPNECCGLIAGPLEEPVLDQVIEARNDIEARSDAGVRPGPRTGRTSFAMDELWAAKALVKGARSGHPIKVIYHSHCDCGPKLSEEDVANFVVDGLLMWPCALLVVSVRAGKFDEHRLWVYRAGTNRFEESMLIIDEPS